MPTDDAPPDHERPTEWADRFNGLQRYVQEHDGQYPRVNDPSGLGRWVSTQRRAYTQPEGTATRPLSEDQIRRLESLPGWTWSAQDYDARWNEKFNTLKEYLGTHDGKYPTKRDPSRLGEWIDTQRKAHNRPEGTRYKPLSEDQIRRLESLPGWTWTGRFN